MYQRLLSQHLPATTFFLFGPRQVGKSTLLAELNPALSLDLLLPELQLAYNKNPSLLLNEIKALPPKEPKWIIIDEIQRVPQLLDVIHHLMAKSPHLNFALSGSSARKLKHGAANLLGGRAVYRTLHPLTYTELAQDFDLDRVLQFGSLPKITTCLIENKTELAQDLLRSYVVTYLKEEIKSEALVRNLQGFQNFIDIAASQFAEQVNFTDISRQCQVAYATVRDYYSILEDTLMGFSLPPFLKSMRKRMSHSPKFYFFDNGVTRSLLGTLKSPINPMDHGRLFEQYFIQEVTRLNAYYQKDWKLSFWRTAHGAEVDLIIEQGSKIVYAIECKAKKVISKSDLTGIKAFKENFPQVPCCVVGRITVPQSIDDIAILPVENALNQLQALG